ncbi:MAG: nuclear transport factor 2 family protein [Terracidiphilus sp.]
MSTAALHEQTERAIDERSIREVIAALHRAHYDKDPVAVAAQYADNAAIFNLAPPLQHRGVNIEEKKAWMNTWETPIEIVPRDMKITVSGDFAFAHGYLELNGTKKGPEGSVRFWMRETLCFERTRGSWRIMHEHTSVPFYMDASLRPAFDLQPEAA